MHYRLFQFADSPLLHLFLLSLGLGLCLYLFVTLKRDIFRLDRRFQMSQASLACSVQEQTQTLSTSLQAQSESIENIRNEVKEITDRVNLLTPSAPPATGINLVKRTQVLQMARRGNRPDQIASCLHVPQNEVDLVLKVQRTMVKSF